jgi:hypothetical protein
MSEHNYWRVDRTTLLLFIGGWLAFACFAAFMVIYRPSPTPEGGLVFLALASVAGAMTAAYKPPCANRARAVAWRFLTFWMLGLAPACGFVIAFWWYSR